MRAAAATARHQSLVALSLSLRETNRAVAAMLAVLAWRQEPDALAKSALREVLLAESGFLGYRYLRLGNPRAAAAVPHDGRVLMALGDSVALVDPDTGEASTPFGRTVAYNWNPSVLRVSPDGTRAVQLVAIGGSRALPPAAHLARLRPGDAQQRRRTDTRTVPRDRCGHQPGRQSGDRDRRARWALGRRDVGRHERAGAGPRCARGSRSGLRCRGRRIPGDLEGTRPRSGRADAEHTARPDRAPWLHLPQIASGRRPAGRGGMVRTRRLRPADCSAGLAGRPGPQGGPWVPVARGLVPLGRVYCGSAAGLVEELGIRTGEATASIELDPQFGRGGDLVMDRGTDGAQVLLKLSASEPIYARWSLTGSGLGGGLVHPEVAPDALACSLAGRNPTVVEWNRYVGRTAPYVEVCPDFPTAQDQFSKEDE